MPGTPWGVGFPAGQTTVWLTTVAVSGSPDSLWSEVSKHLFLESEPFTYSTISVGLLVRY